MRARHGELQLRDFIKRVTPRYPAPPHMDPLVWFFERSRYERVLGCVSYPPRYGKTETAINGLSWRLYEDPVTHNAFCSYASDLAVDKSRKIQQRFVEAGGLLDPTSTRRDAWNTEYGGALYAVGVDGPLTGKPITGVAVIDDPLKNRKEAESPTKRDAIWDWFTSTLRSRLEPGASIIVIQTRWHDDDLIGRLTSDEYEHEDYEVINIPAVRDARGNPADERVLDPAGKPIRGVFRDDVYPLWPEQYPLEELEQIRRGVGEYDWSALYQGSPRQRGKSLFIDTPSRYSLRWFMEHQAAEGGWECFIACDPAATEKTSADYTVMGVGLVRGYGPKTEIFIADVYRDQISIPKVARALHRLHKAWGAPVACEAVGGFKAVPQMLKELERDIRLIPVAIQGDKFTRAQTYAAAWNDGRIHVPVDAEWAAPFIREHHSFTGIKDAHDDQVDFGCILYNAAAHRPTRRNRGRTIAPQLPLG